MQPSARGQGRGAAAAGGRGRVPASRHRLDRAAGDAGRPGDRDPDLLHEAGLPRRWPADLRVPRRRVTGTGKLSGVLSRRAAGCRRPARTLDRRLIRPAMRRNLPYSGTQRPALGASRSGAVASRSPRCRRGRPAQARRATRRPVPAPGRPARACRRRQIAEQLDRVPGVSRLPGGPTGARAGLLDQHEAEVDRPRPGPVVPPRLRDRQLRLLDMHVSSSSGRAAAGRSPASTRRPILDRHRPLAAVYSTAWVRALHLGDPREGIGCAPG